MARRKNVLQIPKAKETVPQDFTPQVLHQKTLSLFLLKGCFKLGFEFSVKFEF
jgi:hypothetical protein